MSRVIVVANRLPIVVGKTMRTADGGLVSALEDMDELGKMKWVGWPGAEITQPGRKNVFQRFCRKHDLVAVILNAQDIRDHYYGFSNASLWPMLHYMAGRMRHEVRWWQAYQRVNEKFARAVLRVAGKDDAVWVHDYHLMLLPALLRQRRPDLRIGFFLHTPFPSYEVFRCHPNRRELLRGLLGADLLGFQTFGYLRHFRSTVLRALGMEPRMDVLEHDGRKTHLAIYPIGANVRKFQVALGGERFRECLDRYRRIYRDKRIVLNVERLDYTKGIPRRLQAIDLYLSEHPEMRRKVVFLFVSVPSRREVPEYQDLRAQVERQVGNINGRHATVGNVPIHFLHKAIPFTDLCALYTMAEVGMVTPLRDGMNLVAKEYVICQEDGDGVLVLSELSGAAEELFSALLVNPFDVHAIAGRLEEALNLSKRQRRERMVRMRQRVLEFDSRYWAKSFVEGLRRLPPMAPTVLAPCAPRQVTREIAARFAAAARIACFLDYDGTLREFESDPDEAAPTDEIRLLLKRLCARPEVDVYLISGREHQELDGWFGRLPCTLLSEHGYMYRARGGKRWKLFSEMADFSWKENILKVFRHYEGTTPGSTVEEKRSSVVWHYRRSDLELGRWKAQQLVTELTDLAANLPVETHYGHMIVEVCSNHVNKRVAAEKFLRQTPADLVFCAGDDQTDENMFRLQMDGLVTVKVGQGNTLARYRLPDPAHLRKLLERCLEALGKAKRRRR